MLACNALLAFAFALLALLAFLLALLAFQLNCGGGGGGGGAATTAVACDGACYCASPTLLHLSVNLLANVLDALLYCPLLYCPPGTSLVPFSVCTALLPLFAVPSPPFAALRGRRRGGRRKEE